MTALLKTTFAVLDPADIPGLSGRIVIFATPDGGLDPVARRVDRLTRGAVARALASDAFAALKPGGAQTLAWPQGLAAEALLVVKLARKPEAAEARRAGAAIAAFNGSVPLSILAPAQGRVSEVALGLALRAYDFIDYRSPSEEKPAPNRAVTILVRDPEAAAADYAPLGPRPRASSSPAISPANPRMSLPPLNSRAASRACATSGWRSRSSTSRRWRRSECARCWRWGRDRTARRASS